MKTQHTQGEWRHEFTGVEGQFSPPRKIFTISAGLKVVAKIFTRANDNEAEANAKLIAAAPKMIKALWRVYDEVLFVTETEEEQSVLREVVKAIQSAYGMDGETIEAIKEATS